MSHYDVLGVPKDATAGDIRAAWRARSSALHPDKHGGSSDAQAAVNRAYEVLYDEERRAHYDRTGEDTTALPLQTQANEVLMMLFGQALDENSPNVLASMRSGLQGTKQGCDGNLAGLRLRQRMLEKKRAAIAVKGDDTPNLMHRVIDQRIAGIEQSVRELEERKIVADLALAALDRYEERAEADLATTAVPPLLYTTAATSWA
jgi:curved DNA-binding protein CbpA